MNDSKEIEKKKKKVLDMCICPSCPSWEECGEKGGFCLATIGKSACIEDEKGCICPGCPVTDELGLTHDYYCTRGSEKEQGK